MGICAFLQGRQTRATENCQRPRPEAVRAMCTFLENIPATSERFAKARRTTLIRKHKNLFHTPG